MENPTLNLVPAAEENHRLSPSEAAISGLLTVTDQLRHLMEGHNERLDHILTLLKERPARSAAGPRNAKVWCLPCGAVCQSGDEACSACGAVLRDLRQLANDELKLELETPGGRFDARGWELLGQCPVDCTQCMGPLHCAVKLYESRGNMQKYWALICCCCSSVRQLGGLWREQKDSLQQWARSQPLLAPDPLVEKQRALSPTLTATWESIQSGLGPEEVAASRGLALTTIYGHLGLLVQLGYCALEDLVSAEIVECIVAAHEKYPRPVDLADLEARLPMPLLRQDLNLVVRALQLEMGLGDPVDEPSRDRVRQTMLAAVGTYAGQLTLRDLLGMCLGTEGYRTGSFANRAYFGSLRGFAQEGLAEELRSMIQANTLAISAGKKLALPEP